MKCHQRLHINRIPRSVRGQNHWRAEKANLHKQADRVCLKNLELERSGMTD